MYRWILAKFSRAFLHEYLRSRGFQQNWCKVTFRAVFDSSLCISPRMSSVGCVLQLRNNSMRESHDLETRAENPFQDF